MQQQGVGPLQLGSCGPGKLTEKGKFPKVLRGGCKRSFGPREQRSPKSLLHHPKPIFAPVAKAVVGLVQKTFRRPLLPGSKRPFAPSPKHFWEFPLFGQFPRPAASQHYKSMGFRVHLSVICFHLATRFLEMAIGVLSVQFGQGNSVATPQVMSPTLPTAREA